MIENLVWIAVALGVVGVYLSWTAGRLDRLHTRMDAARAALDAQLVRRASVVLEVATSGALDPASSLVLYEAAHGARQAEEEQREVAESELSQALRAVFADADQVEVLKAAPGERRRPRNWPRPCAGSRWRGGSSTTPYGPPARCAATARCGGSDWRDTPRSRSPSKWTMSLRWTWRTVPHRRGRVRPVPRGTSRGATGSTLALAVDWSVGFSQPSSTRLPFE